MKRKHFGKLKRKRKWKLFCIKEDRNENYRETDNSNGIIVSLVSINLSTESKVSVECGTQNIYSIKYLDNIRLRYIAQIPKSCICKESNIQKATTGEYIRRRQKDKSLNMKWDLFRLKQRAYTS